MLANIKQYLYPGESRIIPHWIQYVEALNRNIEIRRAFHVKQPGYETKGIQLLRHLLNYLDFACAKKQNSDLQFLNLILKNIKTDLNNVFDSFSTGVTYKNYFVAKDLGTTAEYLVPVFADYTKALPLDQSWREWEKVKPIRIWDYDSDEYTLNIVKSYISFRREPPNYLVITIDPIALLLKYYHYRTQCDTGNQQKNYAVEFIHKHVYNHFFIDLANIWLMQQISKIVAADTAADANKLADQKLIHDNMYGYIGSRYKEACLDMHNHLQFVKSGNMTANSFLTSPVLIAKQSIFDKITETLTELQIEPLTQYKHFVYLRDRQLFRITIKVMEQYKTHTNYKNIIMFFKRRLRWMLAERPWSSCKDSKIAGVIKSELAELAKYIELH